MWPVSSVARFRDSVVHRLGSKAARPVLALALAVTAAPAFGQSLGQPLGLSPERPRAPAEFVANDGQWPEEVLYQWQRKGATLRLYRNDLRLHWYTTGDLDAGVDGSLVQLSFLQSDESVSVGGEQRMPGARSYIVGADPSRWRTDVAAYGRVRYEQLYPGIDLVVRTADGWPEYDLHLQPGADLSQVRVACEGVDGLRLDDQGRLSLETPLGPVVQGIPHTFAVNAEAEVKPVRCQYRILEGDTFGFQVEGWESSSRLVIDPGLKWSTYLGSAASDFLFVMEVAGNGDVVLAGEVGGDQFPTTPGAYQGSRQGIDGYLARFDPTGSTLLYASFFGGSGRDSIFDLKIGSDGTATFCGWTDSTDFPTTAGVIRSTFAGGNSDSFVARMSLTAGSTPIYSTYLGTPGDELGLNVVVDDQHDAYVGGITTSSQWPMTFGAYDPTFNGSVDVYVIEVKSNGRQYLNSTYLGGSGNDAFFSAYYIPLRLFLDATGITVASQSNSGDFPTTTGAYGETPNGGYDAFVSRLDRDLSTLQRSTLMGGSRSDYLYALDIDAAGTVIAAGYTGSVDLPTTANAYDTSANNPIFFTDCWLASLTPDYSTVPYYTYLGGSTHDAIRSLKIEPTGQVIAVGTTDSQNFPVTPSAFDTTKNGPSAGIAGQDAFLVRLDLTAGTEGLKYSTFLGGASLDLAKDVELSGKEGEVLLAGDTISADFPVTSNALQTNLKGGLDPFYSRFQIASWRLFGQGLAGGSGVPFLDADAAPILGTSLNLRLNNSSGLAAVGLLLYGFQENPGSSLGPGEVHLIPNWALAVPLAPGLNLFPTTIPADPALLGLESYFQALQWDPAAAGSIAFSQAMKLVFGG